MVVTEHNDSAKVFMSGKSQAVRLPKKYRFPEGCNEVSIRQVGNTLVLAPRYKTWEDLWANMEPVDNDFVEAVLDAKNEGLAEDVSRTSFDE